MKSSFQWILLLMVALYSNGVHSSDEEEDYHSDNSSPPDTIGSTNNGNGNGKWGHESDIFFFLIYKLHA